jgi:hypothetical protein
MPDLSSGLILGRATRSSRATLNISRPSAVWVITAQTRLTDKMSLDGRVVGCPVNGPVDSHLKDVQIGLICTLPPLTAEEFMTVQIGGLARVISDGPCHSLSLFHPRYAA